MQICIIIYLKPLIEKGYKQNKKEKEIKRKDI